MTTLEMASRIRLRVRADDPHNHVHITNDGGRVSRNEVHISKAAGEAVFWTHDGSREVRIVFDKPEGSPFQREDPFVVQPGERISSGPLDDSTAVGSQYRYTVVGADASNDPVVIIDN